MFDRMSATAPDREDAFLAAVERMLAHPSAAPLLAAGATVHDMGGSPGWSLVCTDGPVLEGTPEPPLDLLEGGGDRLAAAFAPLRASLESGCLLLDRLRSEQRSIGAAQARRARAIAGFCRSRPSSADRPDTGIGAAAAATRAARPAVLGPVSEWAVDEVATALSITSARAQAWMVQSLQLVDRLPATLDALAAGQLTWDHATALCEVLGPLDDAIRPQAEARVLARLGHKTPPQLRAAAHRVAQRLDGEAIGRRVESALRERAIRVHPTGDGLGSLSLTDLPLPVLRAVEDALRQYADAAATPGDSRTRQQRMVDCLLDLVLRPGEHRLAPVQAQLTIVATVRTMLGGDEPGEVSGDTVPAGTVRALARALGLLPGADGTAAGADHGSPVDQAGVADLADLLGKRCLSGTALAARPRVAVVDELTGQLLALTDAAGLRAGQALGPPAPTGSYTPTAELLRHVRLRDRRCRFPGCRRPGRRCDLHHVVRWPLGATSAENLCSLCRHHHRLVHQAPGWRLAALPGGRLRFTTPTGQVLTTHPPGNEDHRPPGDPLPDDPPRGAAPPGAAPPGAAPSGAAPPGAAPRDRPPPAARRPAPHRATARRPPPADPLPDDPPPF